MLSNAGWFRTAVAIIPASLSRPEPAPDPLTYVTDVRLTQSGVAAVAANDMRSRSLSKERSLLFGGLKVL